MKRGPVVPYTPSKRRKSDGGSNYASSNFDPGSQHWVGRFRGPFIRGDPTRKYTKAGIVQHRENSEQVFMDNVAYVGATSFNVEEILTECCIALLRRLFRTEGPWQQDFLDADTSIVTNATSNIAWDFHFRQVRDPSITITRTAGNGANLPFVNWFTTATSLYDAGLQLAAHVRALWVTMGYESYSLFKVTMTSRITATNQIMVYKEMDIEDWKYKCFSNLSMKIQNGTVSDGGDGDRFNVASNPLNGVLYRFKDMTPEVKDYLPPGQNWGQNLCELRSDNSGLIIPNTAVVGQPVDGWNNLPLKSMFKNCQSAMVVRLEPGHIKFTTLRFKFTGTMVKLLRGIFGRADAQPGNTRNNKDDLFGTSFLFAFEKTLRTGATSVILNYMFEVTSGAAVYPAKKLQLNQEVTIGAAPPNLPAVP